MSIRHLTGSYPTNSKRHREYVLANLAWSISSENGCWSPTSPSCYREGMQIYSEAKKDYMAEELVGLYRGIWRDMAHALSTIHQTRLTETPALLSDQSSLLAEVTNLIRWSPPIQPRRTELANFTRNLSDSSFIYTSLSVQNQVLFPLSEHTLATETTKFYISTRSLTTFSLQK